MSIRDLGGCGVGTLGRGVRGGWEELQWVGIFEGAGRGCSGQEVFEGVGRVQ